jgi:hypothetical protein
MELARKRKTAHFMNKSTVISDRAHNREMRAKSPLVSRSARSSCAENDGRPTNDGLGATIEARRSAAAQASTPAILHTANPLSKHMRGIRTNGVAFATVLVLDGELANELRVLVYDVSGKPDGA